MLQSAAVPKEKVRRLGADEVVDYHVGPFGSQLKDQPKFDVVFDFVGGKPVEQDAKRVMKKGAKFITACGPMAAVGDRQLSCCEWYGWACGLTCRLCACCAAGHADINTSRIYTHFDKSQLKRTTDIF